MITPERPGEGDDRLSFENGSLSTKTEDFDELDKIFS
jgi:hypothetical protein